MNIFYTPDIQGENYQLSESESRHCVRVLRLREGDCVQLIDGRGNFFKAQITQAHPKHCLVAVRETLAGFGKRPYFLHIAIAPTKSIDRFEWFLEKATEIGIDRITPLLCERSERKKIKPERLARVVVAAAKQSLKAYVPEIEDLISFQEFLDKPQPPKAYIAHCARDLPRVSLKSALFRQENSLILIGPEGDFSPAEIEHARQKKIQAVSLGKSRLRTETAALVACHTAALANQE